ncbi:malate dehydrogenase, partial [Escherichia coli]|nr:malate dehydrogenase [Escherichia coli]
GLSLVRALQGEEGVVECAYVEGDGEHTTYFAQPVKLGKEGVEEVLSYGNLSDYEKSALDGMLATLNGDINIGVEFAK